MTDKIVDLTAARDAEEHKIQADASDIERRSMRARLIANAIYEMKAFSSNDEIANTLRSAADTLERRE